MEIKKITGDDYIPDMLQTVNTNFENIASEIEDIAESVNGGDSILNTVTVNPNGETTDTSYTGKGKMINDGDIESTSKVKSKTIEVTDGGTVAGDIEFESASFSGNTEHNGDTHSFNGTLNIQKDVRIPSRIIASVADTGTIGAINGSYQINIEGDYVISIDRNANNDLDVAAKFKFINGKPNQVIHILIKEDRGVPVLIDINGINSFSITKNCSVAFLWNQLNEINNTGEWVVIQYSNYNANII